MKPNLNIYTAEAGSGKTESVIINSVADLIMGKSSLIVQPSALQLPETKQRLLDAFNAILQDPDFDTNLLSASPDYIINGIKVFLSNDEGDNGTKVIRVAMDNHDHSIPSIIIVTHAFFSQYKFGPEFSKWNLYVDESLSLVDSRELSIPYTGELVTNMFKLVNETPIEGKEWSILTIDDKNAEEFLSYQERANADSLLKSIVTVFDQILDPDLTVYCPKGMFRRIGTNASDTFFHDIDNIFRDNYNTDDVYNKIKTAFDTSDFDEELSKIFHDDFYLDVTNADTTKKQVTALILSDKKFSVFSVLKATVLTKFAEVTLLGANMRQTVMAKIWNIYPPFELKEQFDEMADIIAEYGGIITSEEYRNSELDIQSYFNVVECDTFTKHTRDIIIFTPEEESMSGRKRDNNAEIEETMLAHMKERIGDSEYIYLDNSKRKKKRYMKGGEDKVAKDVTHNAHGQNHLSHINNAVVFSNLTPRPSESKFFAEILGINANNLSIMRHLDTYYQIIMRSSLRDRNSKEMVRVWMMNTMMAVGLSMYYFDNCQLITVPNTKAVTRGKVMTVEMRELCEKIRNNYPELAELPDEYLCFGKEYRVVDGKKSLGAEAKHLLSSFNPVTGLFKETGKVADFNNKKIISSYLRIKDYEDISGEAMQGAVGAPKLTTLQRKRATAIRKNNPDLSDMTTEIMVATGVLKQYSKNGNKKEEAPVKKPVKKPMNEAEKLLRDFKNVQKQIGVKNVK